MPNGVKNQSHNAFIRHVIYCVVFIYYMLSYVVCVITTLFTLFFFFVRADEVKADEHFFFAFCSYSLISFFSQKHWLTNKYLMYNL